MADIKPLAVMLPRVRCHMLGAIALGSLWGSCLGHFFQVQPNYFTILQVLIITLMALIVFVLTKFHKASGYVSSLLLAGLALVSFAWAAIHNPEPIKRNGDDLQVFWSMGCADSEQDILVGDHRQVYLARGTAMVGDLVELSRNKFRAQFFKVNTTGLRARVGILCEMFAAFRAIISESLNAFPADIRGWLSGFALGRSLDVDKSLVEAFRNVGLLHVLVLSGGHLSVVAGMLLLVLRGPFLVFYFLRCLTITRWIYVWNLTALVAVLILFSFCAVVGFAQSVQRAFLNFFVLHVVGMIGLAQDTKSKIKLTFCLQALIFPVNLLSLSLFLSWSGSLLLHSFYESTYLKSTAGTFEQVVKIQLIFTAVSLLFFGQVGIMSPLANLFALPILAVLLPLDLIAIFFHPPWIYEWFIKLNRMVMDGVRFLDYYQSTMWVGQVRIPQSMTINAAGGRLTIVFLLTAFFMLSGLRQQETEST